MKNLSICFQGRGDGNVRYDYKLQPWGGKPRHVVLKNSLRIVYKGSGNCTIPAELCRLYAIKKMKSLYSKNPGIYFLKEIGRAVLQIGVKICESRIRKHCTYCISYKSIQLTKHTVYCKSTNVITRHSWKNW